MANSFRKAMLLGFAAILGSACDTEHHQLGAKNDGVDAGNTGGTAGVGATAGVGGTAGVGATAGNPPDGPDARSDPDGDAGAACRCSPSTPMPGSPGPSFGIMPLPCFCEQFYCPSYEDSLDLDKCQSGNPLWLSTFSNCDQILVELGGGYSGVSYTYDANTHELLGVRSYVDIATIPCGNRNVNQIFSGITQFADCTLVEKVDLCE